MNEVYSLLFFSPDAQPVIDLTLSKALLGEPPLKRRENAMIYGYNAVFVPYVTLVSSQNGSQEYLTAGTDLGASSAASGGASGC